MSNLSFMDTINKRSRGSGHEQVLYSMSNLSFMDTINKTHIENIEISILMWETLFVYLIDF